MNIEIEKKLNDLKLRYEALNAECVKLESITGLTGIALELRNSKLNELYNEMKPIADEYNALNARYNNYKNSNAYTGSHVHTSNKKKGIKDSTKAWIAGGLVVLSGLCGYIIAKRNNNNNKIDLFPSNSITQVNPLISGKVDSEKRFSEYLNELNEFQKFNWTRIANFQNYFNNYAANTVVLPEDGEARLYLNAEECLSLFAMINANRYTPEQFVEMFGNAEFFNEENIYDNYVRACRVLNYYYITATEKSGIQMLFVNNKDAEVFGKMEKYLLEHNKDLENVEKKNILHDEFIKFFLNGSLENAKENYPGVYSILATGMGPILNYNIHGVFSEKEMNDILELNETVTCDILRGYVKDAVLRAHEVENQNIINILPSVFDKSFIYVTSRDVNFEARYIIVRSKIHTTGSVGTGSYTTTTTTREEVSREEAVEQFGEEAVAEAEAAAQQEIAEENQHEEDREDGIDDAINSDIYENIYEDVIADGHNDVEVVVPTTDNADYNEGYQEAAEIIEQHAVEDAMEQYNYTQEGNHETVEVTEEYISDEQMEDELALILG